MKADGNNTFKDKSIFSYAAAFKSKELHVGTQCAKHEVFK